MSRQRLKEWTEQKRKEQQKAEPADFWSELAPRIADGQIIPIVSNSIYQDLVFASLLAEPEPGAAKADAAGATDLNYNAEDILADAWATDVGDVYKRQQ